MGRIGTLIRRGRGRAPIGVIPSWLLAAALALSLTSALNPARASDRDRPPYMIYIDPETGKYTTTPPGHEPAGTDRTDAKTAGDTPSGDEPPPRSPSPDKQEPAVAIPETAPAMDTGSAGGGTGKAVYLTGGGLLLAFAAGFGLVLRRRKRAAPPQ